MKKPIDVPTDASAAFIAAHLSPEATILEVGCGKGDVALALLNRGYRVIGLDSDQEVAARAQTRGVLAVHTSWPNFECPPGINEQVLAHLTAQGAFQDLSAVLDGVLARIKGNQGE